MRQVAGGCAGSYLPPRARVGGLRLQGVHPMRFAIPGEIQWTACGTAAVSGSPAGQPGVACRGLAQLALPLLSPLLRPNPGSPRQQATTLLRWLGICWLGLAKALASTTLSAKDYGVHNQQPAPRISALRQPPVGFAHRGAKAHQRENTVAAFTTALEMGATGLETDAYLTADGKVVLDHDGWVRSGRWGRRKSIADSQRSELPAHIPCLEDLFAVFGSNHQTDVEVSIDLKDTNAADAIMEVVEVTDAALEGGGKSLHSRVWLCHPNLAVLQDLRSRYPNVCLCNSTRLSRLSAGPERRASELCDAGIQALNLHQTDWTGGLVTLFHRFGVYCFGWDAQQPRVLNELLDMGIDAVYSDHTDKMMSAINSWYPN